MKKIILQVIKRYLIWKKDNDFFKKVIVEVGKESNKMEF